MTTELASHWAVDLIETELQRAGEPVEWEGLRERCNLGAEDFQAALTEMEHGRLVGVQTTTDGVLVRFIPEEDRVTPSPEAEEGAGGTPESPPSRPHPSEPPAEAFALTANHPLALLAAEAARSGAQMRLHARVDFIEQGDGTRLVTAVHEVYGVNLVHPDAA